VTVLHLTYVALGLLSTITAKVYYKSIETWCYFWAYQWKESLNFWWWSVPGYGLLFHFPQHCRMRYFRSISISHTVTGRFSRNLAKWLTPTREWIHNISGSDPGVTRIWISSEIRIRIPDHFRSRQPQGTRCTWLWRTYWQRLRPPKPSAPRPACQGSLILHCIVARMLYFPKY